MGGGGSSTTTSNPSYISGLLHSPHAMKLWALAFPQLRRVFSGGQTHPLQLYNVPDLDVRTAQTAKAPNFLDYTMGGQNYDAMYGSMAPSLWNTYQQKVENPLVDRFAGSGTLGSPTAGLSGAAANALASRRSDVSKDIMGQVQDAAMQGYQGGMTQYAAQNAMNLANMNALNQGSLNQWQANLQRSQYPWQIITGVLGAGMPQPYVAQGSTTSTTQGGK